VSGNVQAARLQAHGEPLEIEGVELAEPGGGEVRVELHYAGVNPIDRYVAEGRVAPEGPLPRTLGGEAAGTLEGEAVLVAGAALGSARDGVWAQAAVVPEEAVHPLPAGVDLRAAAAMGIAGLTAWEAVRELADVQAEDRVLVLGASGGVGSIIVSLVRAAGATLWGQTGTEDKAAFIEGQGADRVLVGEAKDLRESLSELQPTVVFDPLGGEFVPLAVEGLAPRGRLVSFGTSAGPQVSFNMQTLYRNMLTVRGYGGMQLGAAERREGLQAALRALSAGELRVSIDQVLPLAEVGEAFGRLEGRKVQGKLLLEL